MKLVKSNRLWDSPAYLDASWPVTKAIRGGTYNNGIVNKAWELSKMTGHEMSPCGVDTNILCKHIRRPKCSLD